MFKDLKETGLNEDIIWKAVIRFAKLNSIPLARGMNNSYIIAGTRFKKGMRMTTDEYKQLTGKTGWKEIKQDIKDSGFELETKVEFINGMSKRLFIVN